MAVSPKKRHAKTPVPEKDRLIKIEPKLPVPWIKVDVGTLIRIEVISIDAERKKVRFKLRTTDTVQEVEVGETDWIETQFDFSSVSNSD